MINHYKQKTSSQSFWLYHNETDYRSYTTEQKNTYRKANGSSGSDWRIVGRRFCIRFSGNTWLNFNLTPYAGTGTSSTSCCCCCACCSCTSTSSRSAAPVAGFTADAVTSTSGAWLVMMRECGWSGAMSVVGCGEQNAELRTQQTHAQPNHKQPSGMNAGLNVSLVEQSFHRRLGERWQSVLASFVVVRMAHSCFRKRILIEAFDRKVGVITPSLM